jgi:hypothetical protein
VQLHGPLLFGAVDEPEPAPDDPVASSPETIRAHAERAFLPVTEIVPIADTVIVRPDPAAWSPPRHGGRVRRLRLRATCTTISSGPDVIRSPVGDDGVERGLVVAIPDRIEPGPPEAPARGAGPTRRHLELVPPPEDTSGEARRVRETRWVALLLAVATAVFFALWTASVLGAADTTWWPALVGALCALVVALGAVVVRRTR